MVKRNPANIPFFRKVHTGLGRRFEGPYSVIAKIGNSAYKPQLPEWFKLNPVFHDGKRNICFMEWKYGSDIAINMD